MADQGYASKDSETDLKLDFKTKYHPTNDQRMTPPESCLIEIEPKQEHENDRKSGDSQAGEIAASSSQETVNLDGNEISGNGTGSTESIEPITHLGRSWTRSITIILLLSFLVAVTHQLIIMASMALMTYVTAGVGAAMLPIIIALIPLAPLG